MAFFTPSGLAAIAQNESGNNPTSIEANSPLCTAQGNCSSSTGLYQFIQGTWNTYAPQAGVDLSQYPTAASAPADVQTSVAAVTPVSNWAFSNANNSVIATPGMTTPVPITGTSIVDPAMSYSIVSPATTTGTTSLSQALNLPGLLSPTQNASTTDALGNPYPGTTGPLGTIFTTLADWFQRGAVLILGLIIIAIGLWALVKGEHPVSAATRGVKRTLA